MEATSMKAKTAKLGNFKIGKGEGKSIQSSNCMKEGGGRIFGGLSSSLKKYQVLSKLQHRYFSSVLYQNALTFYGHVGLRQTHPSVYAHRAAIYADMQSSPCI